MEERKRREEEREKERARGREKRYILVRSPSVPIFVSTVLFLDGLIGERILVLGRLTEDRSSSV